MNILPKNTGLLGRSLSVFETMDPSFLRKEAQKEGALQRISEDPLLWKAYYARYFPKAACPLDLKDYEEYFVNTYNVLIYRFKQIYFYYMNDQLPLFSSAHYFKAAHGKVDSIQASFGKALRFFCTSEKEFQVLYAIQLAYQHPIPSEYHTKDVYRLALCFAVLLKDQDHAKGLCLRLAHFEPIAAASENIAQFAAAYGVVPIVQEALSAKSCSAAQKKEMLLRACKRGHEDLVECLLKEEIEQDPLNWAFVEAAFKGHQQLLPLFVKKGCVSKKVLEEAREAALKPNHIEVIHYLSLVLENMKIAKKELAVEPVVYSVSPRPRFAHS